MYGLLYAILRSVMGASLFMLARVRVDGMQNIPRQGAVILAANHRSWADGPLILSMCPRRLRGLAADTYRNHPVFGPALRLARCIFISRGRYDRTALRRCLAVLANGEALALAIEGTRGSSARLGEGKTGAAWLANQSQAPVVPVAVYGTDCIMACLRRGRRAAIGIRVGEPIRARLGSVTTNELSACTNRIMEALDQLLAAGRDHQGGAENA